MSKRSRREDRGSGHNKKRHAGGKNSDSGHGKRHARSDEGAGTRSHRRSPSDRPGPRRQPLSPAVIARLGATLADMPLGATAAQLAAALGLPSTSTRELSAALRSLVETGQVLETRPGRYQVSGTGGEFSAMIEDLPQPIGGATLQARFPDERLLPIHPRHTLGVRAGDVAQAVVGEDGYALVTRILRRTGREVVGTVNFRDGGEVFVSDNRREGELPVLSTFPQFEDRYQAGDRVLATIEVDSQGRAGVHVTGVLDEESPEVADFLYAKLLHDLPGEFPPAADTEAAGHPRTLPLGTRTDLRGELVFTIDPTTAKDFDDAISLKPRGDGWTLGVHIADVSHYVREGGAVDAEAAQRGTSIYLINRVIPMLPEVLSNGLCSLVPREDRYCLSVFLDLDRGFRLVGTRLAETLIHSRHRMDYGQALDVIEGRDQPGLWPDDLKQVLLQVHTIAQGLRAGREVAGAINLYSVEHNFRLDINGIPIESVAESSDVAHQLIEECMLLANRAVAEWLTEHHSPAVFRLHAPPDPEKLQLFARIVEAYGKDSTGVHDRFGLQRFLRSLRAEPRAAQLVLNLMCLRCFKKATYGVDNVGHFALAFDAYLHFTSPIRRYPDLLCHRLVKRVLALPAYRHVEVRASYLDALAKQSSFLEGRAEDAERTLHARKAARYLATRIGETFPSVVTGATGGGLFVQLLETGLEGMLPLRELKDDYYVFDPERFALIGRRSARALGPGTEIDAQVVSVDIDRSDVVLGMAGTARTPGQMQRPAGQPTRPLGQALRPPVPRAAEATPHESDPLPRPPTVKPRPVDEAPRAAVVKPRPPTVREFLDRKAEEERTVRARPAEERKGKKKGGGTTTRREKRKKGRE